MPGFTAPRHAIDVDNVLRDFIGSVALHFDGVASRDWNLTYNTLVERYFDGDRQAFVNWMDVSAPWEDMPLEDKTVPNALNRLHKAGHKLLVVSATHDPRRSLEWFRNRYLDHYFAEWHWVQQSKKAHVLTDSLIDDNPAIIETVAKWDARRGDWPRILVVRDQPWNRDIDVGVRVTNLAEYADLMIEQFGAKND